MFTREFTRRRSESLPGAVLFAATSLLLTMACGAGVPAKPEAAAVLSKAIASTLTRTLPSVTYCMTTPSDYSFMSLGQVDLVATFQNVIDKDPLYDAVRAEAVRIELKEFGFDPAGRSPDSSCDALHSQSKQSGLQRGQGRLAVVRTTLTPKAAAAGVPLGTPIDVATRELVDVIGIRSQSGGFTAVKYTWKWSPTQMAAVIGYEPAASQDATARLRHSDSGWVVEDAGIKR